MSSPLKARLRGARGQLWLAAFLVATVILSVWLGYQALDAAQSHRRTAEGVLRDYAGLAAWQYARSADEQFDEFLHEVLDDRRRGRWRAMSPRDMAWEMDDAAEDARCRCEGLLERTVYFQLDPRTGAGSAHPDTLPPGLLARLGRSTVADYDPVSHEPYGTFSTEAGQITGRPAVVAYSMSPDTSAVHGFVAEHAAMAELFERWYEASSLLSPAIAASSPLDSLLFLSVLDARGEPIFRSATPYPPTFLASDTLDAALGSLVVEATVRPDAADRLIIGGLPRSRLPLLGTLLVLTLAMGAAALVQLRREHELARLRDDFVSGVSHEFRTPLTQIRVFSELLEEGKLATEGERRRSIDIIHREARRLSNLVENVLHFSELRRNGAEGTGEPSEEIDFRQIVEDVFEGFRPLASARRSSLEAHVEPGLSLDSSRQGVHRILTNLIDNALKYGPEGQTVAVHAHRENGAVRLAVEDEGAGIDPRDRERVWEPYRRLDRDVTGHVRGSGLGLAVVAELAARHGGRAWVEDRPGGKGARFVIELRGPHERGVGARG